MGLEENKSVVRRVFEEGFNMGDFSIAEEVVSADYTNHEATDRSVRGPEAAKETMSWLRHSFPDLHFAVDEMIAEENQVWALVRMSGTHDNEFAGIPPTGNSFEIKQIHRFRLADGKITDHWAVRDDLGMMQQLGVIPAPGGPAAA